MAGRAGNALSHERNPVREAESPIATYMKAQLGQGLGSRGH